MHSDTHFKTDAVQCKNSQIFTQSRIGPSLLTLWRTSQAKHVQLHRRCKSVVRVNTMFMIRYFCQGTHSTSCW